MDRSINDDVLASIHNVFNEIRGENKRKTEFIEGRSPAVVEFIKKYRNAIVPFIEYLLNKVRELYVENNIIEKENENLKVEIESFKTSFMEVQKCCVSLFDENKKLKKSNDDLLKVCFDSSKKLQDYRLNKLNNAALKYILGEFSQIIEGQEMVEDIRSHIQDIHNILRDNPKVNECKITINEKDKLIEDLNEQIESKRNEHEKEMNSMRETVTSLNEKISKLESDNSELTSTIKQLEGQVEKLKDESKLASKVNAAIHDLCLSYPYIEFDGSKFTVSDQVDSLNDISSERIILQKENDNYRKRISELEERIKNESTAHQMSVHELSSKTKEYKSNYDRLILENKSLKLENMEIRNKLHSLVTDRNSLEGAMQSIVNVDMSTSNRDPYV